MKKSKNQIASMALSLLLALGMLIAVVPSAKAAVGGIEIAVAAPGDAAAVTVAITAAEAASGTTANAMTEVTITGVQLDYNGLRQLYTSLTTLETLHMPSQTTLPTGTPGVFQGHSALRQINLSALQTLGENAFRGCVNLESIGLPLAHTIEGRAFQDCTNLEIISLPQAQVIGPSAFEACPQLTSVSIPQIQTIGRGAFYLSGLTGNLTSITLPDTLTDLGADTFGNGMSGRLTSAVFAGAVPSIMNKAGWAGVFGNPSSIIQVWVPSGAKAAYDSSLTTHVSSTAQIVEYPNAALDFATSISATPAALTLFSGQTGQLTITVSPASAVDKSYYFTSSNNAVASISGDGVVFANASGTSTITVTSSMDNTITASVSITVLGAPTIVTQPSSASVNTGNNATFAVTATDAVSYQWQESTDGGTTWANVSTGTGGTTASYTTAATIIGESGKQFRCLVSNPAGTTTSNAAILTVTSAPAPTPVPTSPSGNSGSGGSGGSGATANTTYTFSQMPSEGNDYTAICNGAYGKLTGVYVDNNLLGSSQYSAWEGSTYVRLNASYINTLSAGAHTLTLMFTDGSASGSFIAPGKGGIVGVYVLPYSGETLSAHTPSVTPSVNTISDERVEEATEEQAIADDDEAAGEPDEGTLPDDFEEEQTDALIAAPANGDTTTNAALMLAVSVLVALAGIFFVKKRFVN